VRIRGAGRGSGGSRLSHRQSLSLELAAADTATPDGTHDKAAAAMCCVVLKDGQGRGKTRVHVNDVDDMASRLSLIET